jgi:hypothetical protein
LTKEARALPDSSNDRSQSSRSGQLMIGRSFAAACVAVTLALFSVSATFAGELQLFGPIEGFSIRPVVGRGAYYGASDSAANWKIAQWGNPGRPLKEFGSVPCASRCYNSVGDAAQVNLEVNGGGYKFSMKQDGTQLPCNRKGNPAEFDLLASPNDMKTILLSKATALPISLRFTVDEAKELEKKGCKVSSGQLLAALVLRNNYTTPVQIFFYQLSLFRFNTSTAATGWWAPGVLRGGGRTKRFGFRDGLSSFDQAAPSVGTPASYDFDLLPRLREIITKGEHGLDTDVDHWQLRSAYFGQHIWGDVSVSSTWDKIQMRAVLAD